MATDLGAGLSEGTAMRTAVLATRIGRLCKLEPVSLQTTYYGSVLRFLGCTANSTEVASMGLGEDSKLLHALGMCDWTNEDALRRALNQYFVPGISEEVRQDCIEAICAGRDGIPGQTAYHCTQAQLLLSRLPVPDRVSVVIQHMYSRWDDTLPGACGTEVPIEARIIAMAAGAELSRAAGGISYVLDMAKERAGTQFDPHLCELLAENAQALLSDYEQRSHWELFCSEEPAPRLEVTGHARVEVAQCFADYVDQKSGWFHGHSRQVASLALRLASELGMPQEERDRVYLAGLLHDIGRAAIPNRVWEKPDSLTPSERREAERHSYHTTAILADAEIFADVIDYAESVHERKDASGYHRRANLDSKAAGCVAVADMYNALTHPRPWRKAIPEEEASKVLVSEVHEGRLPAEIVDALLRAIGQKDPDARPLLPAGLTQREVDILGCLIRGISNKEIAEELGISPKTVENHLTRVYEKTDTNGRAQAGLFALKHGI